MPMGRPPAHPDHRPPVILAYACICNYCSYNLIMSPSDMAPRGCTNFKLRQLLRGVSRLYDAELARAGLKGTQYSLLSHLVALGPLAPGELARRMGMDASTLTRNVQLLIQQGWVSQGPGANTRSRSLAITPAGRAKHSEAKAHWKRAQQDLNQRLGLAEVAALHGFIDSALDKLRGPDSPSSDKVTP